LGLTEAHKLAEDFLFATAYIITAASSTSAVQKNLSNV
jgi:hypothetical protein